MLPPSVSVALRVPVMLAKLSSAPVSVTVPASRVAAAKVGAWLGTAACSMAATVVAMSAVSSEVKYSKVTEAPAARSPTLKTIDRPPSTTME